MDARFHNFLIKPLSFGNGIVISSSLLLSHTRSSRVPCQISKGQTKGPPECPGVMDPCSWSVDPPNLYCLTRRSWRSPLSFPSIRLPEAFLSQFRSFELLRSVDLVSIPCGSDKASSGPTELEPLHRLSLLTISLRLTVVLFARPNTKPVPLPQQMDPPFLTASAVRTTR